MSDYTIVVDTSCDLTAPLRERFGIEYVLRGQIYFPDGHSEPLSLDWEKMTPDEYYSSMKGHNAIYKTSSVPMGEAMEVFETILKSGKDVLSISLSSGLSSSYNETLMVAKELEAKYPDRKVVCVDSLRYSTALALLVILASKKKEEGATLDEVASYLEEIKHSVHQMGFMDDLYFLAKTGRISNAKAFFGTLVGVTPLADFTRHGLSEVVIKTKGRKQAVDATIEYMKQTIVNPEEQIIFIAHSLRKEYADILKEKVQSTFNPKEIIMNDVGMACGASIGPGLCAAYYVGKPLSETLDDEKSMMADIVAGLSKK